MSITLFIQNENENIVLSEEQPSIILKKKKKKSDCCFWQFLQNVFVFIIIILLLEYTAPPIQLTLDSEKTSTCNSIYFDQFMKLNLFPTITDEPVPVSQFE